MPTDVFRQEVQRLLIEEGAQLVEMLPPREYREEHIAGATNIWLRHLTADTAAQLDATRPVIVYCHDAQ
jgi:rhodanese-related sulfurtransferase